MKKVVIFGLGDFARIACIYLEKDSPHEVVAFTAHKRYIETAELLSKPVMPFENLLQTHPPEEYAMFVAIGFKKVNKARAHIYQECKAHGYELISYINSRATHWGEIDIGDNTFIFENNVIQPFVKIGNDVIIWSGSSIAHDAIIGDHCFIASQVVVSGRTTIGPFCFIGANATLRDGIKIAPECVIGAGATILKDTVEQGVYAALDTEPARIPSSRLRGF